MFKEEQLKAFKIVNAKTNEILGMITKDGKIIQSDNIDIIFDYSPDDKKNIKEIDGKFYQIVDIENATD